MKKLLVVLTIFLLISLPIEAEMNEEEKKAINEAGVALIEYSDTFYQGLVYQVTGISFLTLISLATDDIESIRITSVVCGGLVLFGTIIQLIAPLKIKKAGKRLLEISKNNFLTNLDFKLKDNLYDLNYVYRF